MFSMDYAVENIVTYVNALGSLATGTVESLAVRDGRLGAWIMGDDDTLRWVPDEQINPA